MLILHRQWQSLRSSGPQAAGRVAPCAALSGAGFGRPLDVLAEATATTRAVTETS